MGARYFCDRCHGDVDSSDHLVLLWMGKPPDLKVISSVCAKCDEDLDGFLNAHDPDDYDPTPWCHVCGSMTSKKCKCAPTAEND